MLKLFRHIFISLVTALFCTLMLFHIAINSGVIFSPYFILVGIVIALTALATPELSIFLRNVISILAFFVFYFLFSYLIYIDLETSLPSALNDKTTFERGWFYLRNTNYLDLTEFWPRFKQSITLSDVLFALSAMQGFIYFGWKKKLFGFNSTKFIDDSDEDNFGNTFQKKRKVKSRRFRRKF